MYVTGFSPMAMAQSGQMGTSAASPSMAWMGQPTGYGAFTSVPTGMVSAAYPGYMLPMSSVFGTPGFSGSFSIPAGQAVTYGFVPSMGAGMPSTAAGQFIYTGTGMVQPRIELAETNSDIVMTAELPNVNPNDLHLTVTDDSISLSCTAFAGGLSSSVHRTIALPTSVKAEQVTANYSNGILECHLPKSDVMTRRRIRVSPS